jgi:UrcA family protein
VHWKNPRPKGRKELIMKPFTANRYALLGMAMLAAALTANLASAATATTEGPKQTVVKYSDLDLSRPQDARRLYGRIKYAAREVCDNNASSDLHLLKIYQTCLRKAVTDAVAQVQSPQLAAVEQADKFL